DHNALAELARMLNAGLLPDSYHWQPNAGTKLVKDVMNEIKHRFAWIDLLKPETRAAVGLLAVLDPGQPRKITRGSPIFWANLRGTLKVKGILSADETGITDAAIAQELTLAEILGPALLATMHQTQSASVHSDAMLLEAEEHYDKPRAPATSPDTPLGWPQ